MVRGMTLKNIVSSTWRKNKTHTNLIKMVVQLWKCWVDPNHACVTINIALYLEKKIRSVFWGVHVTRMVAGELLCGAGRRVSWNLRTVVAPGAGGICLCTPTQLRSVGCSCLCSQFPVVGGVRYHQRHNLFALKLLLQYPSCWNRFAFSQQMIKNFFTH